MSLILHLSDLHLGMLGRGEILGDHKVEIITPEARGQRTALIRSTLRELGRALSTSGRSLDAVVVSGDVTYAGISTGFDHLEAVLGELADAQPPPEKTLVVPGNHDVQWYTAPSSVERYRDFADKVRGLGYVTPYLEGIDIRPDGSLTSATASPVVVSSDGGFVIVALNSANHCGVELRTDPELEPHLANLRARAAGDPSIQAVLDSWLQRGRFDVARIDPAQRQHASEALRDALASWSGEMPPLRIAVMHHQLLPVSLDEEVKPFESLTNLAEVRDWLSGNGIHMLMHGHKHVGRLYEDRFQPEHHDRRAPLHRVLVSSTATIGLGRDRSGEVAKLIEVDTELPTLGRLRLTSVPATDSGIPLDLSLLPVDERMASVDVNPVGGAVEGATVREVHEQLLALYADGLAATPLPLVCRIHDGASAKTIPASYPSLGVAVDAQAWFDDMVGLWQRSTRLSSMEFNHGERLLDAAGNGHLDRVIATLNAAPDTSRAVVLLVDPDRDRIDDRAVEFPAFCLIQFTVTAAKLNVHAFFRKQEMRYWWPVNVGELALLQDTVRSGLAKSGRPVDSGEIVTITSVPTVGRAVPRVAVPATDRLVDEQPERLLRMALLAFIPSLPQRDEILADWRRLVQECQPGDLRAADGNPVPVEGLRALRRHLETIGQAYADSVDVQVLGDVLGLLVAENIAYLHAERHVPTGAAAVPSQAVDLSERLKQQVDMIEAAGQTPPGA